MRLDESFGLAMLVIAWGAQMVRSLRAWRERVLRQSPGYKSEERRGKSEAGKCNHSSLFALSFSFRLVWWVSIVGILVILTYLTTLQYRAWLAHPVSRYLLPPHQTPAYFISYLGARLYLPWLIAFAAALAIRLIMRAMNRRFGERFFEEEEFLTASLAVFLTGYPGFLVYGAFMFFAALVRTAWSVFAKRGRAPLYHLWLPMGILAILIRQFLIPQEFLARFAL